MSSNKSKVIFGPPFVPEGGRGNPMALPELNAIIAAFSTGPVGVGDGMNATDKAIVLPTCDGAGRLLQPDRPMLAVDATFCSPGQEPRGEPSGKCKSTWMSAADGGAIWNSITKLPNNSQATRFALAINVTRPWQLQRTDLWPRASLNSTFLSRVWGGGGVCTNGSAAVASGCVQLSQPGEPLPDLRAQVTVSGSGRSSAAVGRIDESPFVLVAMHEVMPGGWVVFEEKKYVSLSRRRFKSVREVEATLVLTLSGAVSEVVELVALRPRGGGREWTVVTVRVVIGDAGLTTVRVR